MRGATQRRRQGARHLRVDRREHLPRPQDRAAAAWATSASCSRSGNLGGKCADLNALFVGLARAAGLPARDVYGLRVARSEFGYKSLGAGAEIVTKAQHCRAEVYPRGLRLGAGRSGRRAQGRARGAARQPPLDDADGEDRARPAVRRLGDELARLQLRARRRAARIARARRSASSCTRRPRPRTAASTASIPTTSSTRSPRTSCDRGRRRGARGYDVVMELHRLVDLVRPRPRHLAQDREGGPDRRRSLRQTHGRETDARRALPHGHAAAGPHRRGLADDPGRDARGARRRARR